MKTFQEFILECELNEAAIRELPVYKMTMKMLNKKVNAAQRYKESPTQNNLDSLKKANDDSIKMQQIVNKYLK